MARPTTISDEAILDAARAVFLSKGPAGTTAEIAQQAGISEGSIFKRWKSKDALFRASMEGGFVDGTWIAKLPSRVGKGELRAQLDEIAREIMALFHAVIPLHMMGASLGDEAHAHMKRPDAPPIVARQRLAAYFDAERRLGRIRESADVDVLARTMIGSLYSFVALKLMIGENDPAPIADETYARGLVEVLYRGIAPSTPPPSASPARKR